MDRMPLTTNASDAIFEKGSGTHKMNLRTRPMRGGGRL